MSVATDIAALKARCTAMEKRLTAVESRNVAQTRSILDLRARCDALEARPPFDPVALTASLSALAGRTAELEAQVTKITNFLKVVPPPDPPTPPPPPPDPPTPDLPTITITTPDGAVNWTSGTSETIEWTISEAVAVGEFVIYVVDDSGLGDWFELDRPAAVALQTDYSDSFALSDIAAGSYKVTIWYRVDLNEGTLFEVNDWSAGVVTIAPDDPVPPPLPPDPGPGDYFNAVTEGDCHGDGVTDDRLHIVAAIAEYKALGKTGLYFPAGTYLLSSTLTVSSGTVLVGPVIAARNPNPGYRTPTNDLAGCVEPTAWLKGRVDFGSNSAFSDLKIGDSGACGITNVAGASTSSFTRCQFRGGSTTPVSVNSNVVTLGMNSGSCDHITFTDCNVERNVGPADGNRASFCNLALVNDGSTTYGSHVSYITINRCHVGVTNGVATGSPCFNFVAYTNHTGGYAYHGWNNVVISDSIFEAADQTTLDLADCPLVSNHAVRASGPATVSGCFLKGSGMNAALPFPNCIDIEAPKEVLIENNTMYRCRGKAISFGGGSGDAYGTIIRNNHFLLDQGAAPVGTTQAIYLDGTFLTFTGNDVKVSGGWFPVHLVGVYSSSFTGNTIWDTRAAPPESGNMVVLEGTASVIVTGNTLQNGSGSNPVIYQSAYGGATNVGNTISGNTFIHA